MFLSLSFFLGGVFFFFHFHFSFAKAHQDDDEVGYLTVRGATDGKAASATALVDDDDDYVEVKGADKSADIDA